MSRRETQRVRSFTDITTFTIDTENNIAAYADPAEITNAEAVPAEDAAGSCNFAYHTPFAKTVDGRGCLGRTSADPLGGNWGTPT